MARPERGPPPINLERQLLALTREIPAGLGHVRRSRLAWRARVRPRALSDEYSIEVQYRLGQRPRVFVREPPLRTRNGESPAHMYKDGSLCLYVPGEWQPDMLLAATIVPWTLEWLVHYEAWLATGEWRGGGAAHGPAHLKSPPRTG